ncbi:MAG TPA: LysR family transcriptional regulator [Steroidobacteraceae bacterium]|nr:LysR family transcriptional regulator [Steroidobacteraceae bacterium]
MVDQLQAKVGILRATLRQWQVFRWVAESGTTAAAATALALSQSATSAAVNELERVLALQLFDRVGKRLQLNDNGRAALPLALALLDAAQSLEQWALDRDRQVGSLRIGASTTIGNYLLPRHIARFRRQMGTAAGRAWRPQIRIANSETIAAQVAAFELDLGLIEGPCHEPSLDVEPWLEDELMVVAAADDAIASPGRSRRVPIRTLRRATWLLREPGSGTRETIDQLLLPHLRQIPSGLEFGNSEAIKRAAASGLGITCLSGCVVEDLLATGALVALKTELPPLRRQFFVLTHQRKPRTRGMELFIDYLRATHVAMVHQ